MPGIRRGRAVPRLEPDVADNGYEKLRAADHGPHERDIGQIAQDIGSETMVCSRT